MRCIVLSPDEKTFASVSDHRDLCVCDSETGHCISGPFHLRNPDLYSSGLNACFSPDGKHILVRCRPETILLCHAVVWDIERGEEVFQIKGFDFVFIHCGRNKGRIVSMDWIDEDGSSIQTIASPNPEDQDPRSTRVLVKLWDIGNDRFDRLFKVTGVAVAQFSPNGQYLAVAKQSENVVELLDLEDGKSTHRLPHPSGKLLSLHFSPTSDCVTAAFQGSRHNCFWRLDTQEMVSLYLPVGYCPPAVIHSPHTNYVFVPRYYTVEIWEVSMTSSNMIFETESLTTRVITSICPSHDGHRLLVGSRGGTVILRNMENLVTNKPVAQDTDLPAMIAFSPSGKIVATKSQQSAYVRL